MSAKTVSNAVYTRQVELPFQLDETDQTGDFHADYLRIDRRLTVQIERRLAPIDQYHVDIVDGQDGIFGVAHPLRIGRIEPTVYDESNGHGGFKRRAHVTDAYFTIPGSRVKIKSRIDELRPSRQSNQRPLGRVAKRRLVRETTISRVAHFIAEHYHDQTQHNASQTYYIQHFFSLTKNSNNICLLIICSCC